MGSIAEETPDKDCRKPPGIRFVEYVKGRSISYKSHQSMVLIITFFAYMAYHATRKTNSVVKSALDPQSPGTDSLSSFMWRKAYFYSSNGTPRNGSWVLGEGWKPFDGADGTALLGDLDVSFLFVYALGMYFSGHVGDRMDLRIFLTVGMIGTGLFTALFGIGYWAGIHVYSYYLVVQMLAGLFQSTGWPSVVAVVGNWFGKRKRGFIMGIWNSHTSIGNITGSLVASMLLKYGWGWSMVIPGAGIAFIGVILFMFLPVSPECVGASPDNDVSLPSKDEETSIPLLKKTESHDKHAVGFLEAWRIPGVATFALCLFFAKLVAYTFLYWLPFYISHTAIEGRYLSNEDAGSLSTMFDVGGVIGGILAGHISDRMGARAVTAASFMYCAIPALFLYKSYGQLSMTLNIILMLITGMFVNGPYALITTAVSADLGTHESLKGNSRALATVTAIIDGTGSIGAAIGPLLTGYISAISWNAVFAMLMVAALISGLLLTKLVVAECSAKLQAHEPRAPLESA